MPKDVSITDLIAKAKANLENVARSMPSGKLPTTDDRVALISQLVTALEFVTVPTENEREAWESYTSTVSDFFAETPEIREAFMAGFRLPVPVEPESAEQLDALPEGTVILDNFGDVLQYRGGLWCSYESKQFGSEWVWRKFAPLTVIHLPATPIEPVQVDPQPQVSETKGEDNV